MAWPTEDIPTTNVDNVSDSPSAAIEDLKLGIETINAIVDARGAADGIAPLDADMKLSTAYLDAANLLAFLSTVDGAGSNLDADALDGRQGAEYVLVNGLQPISGTVADLPTGFPVTVTGTATTAVIPALRIVADTSGTPAAGLGAGLGFAVRAGSAPALAANINARWVDPTVASLDSALTIELLTANVLAEHFRFENKRLEWSEVTAPSGNPASGKWWMYFTSAGLFYEDDAGAVVGPLTAGSNVVDHDSLTDRGNDDAHEQYLLVDGSRALTGTLLMDVHPIRFTQTTDGAVATPPSGSWHYYVKSDGALYKKNSSGVVSAAGGSGGSSDHNVLINRDAADAHAQYALLQPSTETSLTFNAAQADRDFRFLGQTTTHLLYADASMDTVGINAAAPHSARLHIEGGAKIGLHVDSDLQGISCTTAGAGSAIAISGIATGDGTALSAIRTAAATSNTYAIVAITEVNASATADAFRIASAGTGDLVQLKYATNSVLLVGTTGLVVNDGKGTAFDLTVRGDTLDELLFCDASNDVVCIGDTGTEARLNVYGGSGAAIYAESSAAAAINATSTSSIAVSIANGGFFPALYSTCTVGGAATLVRSGIASGGASVLSVTADNAADTGPLFTARHDGTGQLMKLHTSVGTMLTVENDGSHRWTILGSDAATPDAGLVSVYAKSNGLYCRLPAGTVIGPFGTGGGAPTDHGALTGLTDDDHVDYLKLTYSSAVRSGGAAAATIAFADNTWTNGLTVSRLNTATNASATALALAHITSGTAAAGLGVDIRMQIEDSAGNLDDAALVQAIWDVATSAGEYAHVAIQTRSNATLATRFRFKDGQVEVIERGSDPGTPASGFWGLYFKSDGLYSIDDAGVIAGPYTTGAGSAAGSATYVQYAGAGSTFDASSDLTFVETGSAQELFLNGRLRITPTGSRVPIRVTGYGSGNALWCLESVVTTGAVPLIGSYDGFLNKDTIISTPATMLLRFISGADQNNTFASFTAADGELRLHKAPASAVFAGLKPSASQSSAYTLTLPVALPGANDYVLSCSTAGVTAWVAASGIGGSPVANDVPRYTGSAWTTSSILTNDGSSVGVTNGSLFVRAPATGSLTVSASSHTVSAPSGSSVAVLTLSSPCIILSVTARVTTALGTTNGLTGFDIGVTGVTQAYGTGLSVGTGAKTVKARIIEADTSTQVLMTATAGTFDGSGVVKFTVMALIPAAPTS